MQSVLGIFTSKKYMPLLIILSVAFLYVIIWMNNITSIRSVFAILPNAGSKIVFLFSLITTLGSSFTPFSLIATLVLVFLFGLNITLVVMYIRERRTSGMKLIFGKGLAGFVAGIFGVGCSACGTALIGPLFAALGISGVLAALPLHGQEFTLLGILVLLFSIWSLVKKMDVVVCEIEGQ